MPNESLKQKVDLYTIFDLQDAAAEQNLQRSEVSREILQLISHGVQINYEILSGTGFEAVKQTIIRHFACDTLSHIAVGVRVGLWGAN